MKTPVIIAAYNEAEWIGKTLDSLDSDTCEPFVIVNGEKGASETTSIASEYTDKVYVLGEQGKMPAIQLGLRKLFDYNNVALGEPILFTDADSVVINSTTWTDSMGKAVEGEVPKSAAGLVLCREAPLIEGALRNINRKMRIRKIAAEPYNLEGAFGSNMALNFANNSRIIEEVMDAPHIWPGEDKYMLHTVAKGDPDKFTQLTDVNSAVAASARYLNRISDRFLLRSDRENLSLNRYMLRRALGVTHTFDSELMRLTAYDK